MGIVHGFGSITTTTGDIILIGEGGDGTDGNIGIYMNNNSTITTADGDILLTGTGGAGSAWTNIGVRMDADIAATGAGSITINGTGGTGTQANYGVLMSVATASVTSVDGDISITGQGGTGSTDFNIGVGIFDADLTSTGTGAGAGTITLTGIGGNGTDHNYGVYISGGSADLTSVDGGFDITGTGGNGSAHFNAGIQIDAGAFIFASGTGAFAQDMTIEGTGGTGTDSAYGIAILDAGTIVGTTDGNLFLTGQGGDGTTHNNMGVLVQDAIVGTAGTGADAGNVTIEGTGGDGSNISAGIVVTRAGGNVTATDGNITLTGIGGTGTGTQAVGVAITDSAVVNTTGAGASAGNISITGTGGNAAGGDNDGIYGFTNSGITVAGPGTIAMTGTAGTVSGSDIAIDTGANVIGGAAAGNITMTGNTMDFANLTATSDEDIILKPRTAARTIGISGGAGDLQITDAMLAMMNPGETLVIGDSAAGTGAVDVSAWDISGETFNVGVYGGTVDFTGAFTYNGANDLTFHSRTGNLAWDQAITKSAGGDSFLLMKAAGNLTLTQNFTPAAGAVDVTLWADADNNAAGGITLTNVAITSGGGDVVLGGGTDPSADFAVGTATAGITLNNGDISSGAGNISIRGMGEAAGASNYGIHAHTGSVLQSTTGGITLIGTGGDGTTDNYGIYLADNGTAVSSADGDIALTGTGGNGSGANNFGVYLNPFVAIASTGATKADAGTITLTGTGRGAGFGFGVDLQNGSILTSVAGNISITGTSTATGASNAGIVHSSSIIASTGTGADAADIVLNGTGSDNGTSTNIGIWLIGAGTDITSVDGDITLTGSGGDGSAADNYGVNISTNSVISSTGAGAGAGNIAITGTGGSGTATDHGIYLNTDVQVTAAGPGTIALTGTAGTGGDDISVANGANVIGGAAAGDVTLTGNTMDLANLTVTSGADIYVQQRTAAGTTIGLGGGAGTLNLTDTELGFFNAGGELIIGRTNGTGLMTVDAYNAWNSPVIFRIDPTGSIVVSGAQTATAASDAAFTFSGPTTLNAGVSTAGATGGTGAILFSDDVTLGADVTVNGGTGGTITFSDIVNGTQDLTLSAGGVITLNGVVGGVTSLDNLTITSNANPVINANVTGTGILTLDTLSAATTMGLGGGAGTVNYTAVEMGRFVSGWTRWDIGNAAATGALTVGALAWSDPVRFIANAAGSILITGNQTTGAGSDTTFTFNGPTTLSANVDSSAATGGTRAIAFNDAVTLGANAQVLAGGGTINFASTINGAFDLLLDTAGIITLTGNIGGTTPLDDLTLTSDADPVIGGTVAGTGVLTLQQKTNTTTMGVAGGVGTFNFSAADLAGLGSAWSTIRLGNTTATGALTVGANAWTNPVEYRSAAGGSIVIGGAQTAGAASDTTFTFSGPTTLNAGVSTAAATGGTQAISFGDDVTLGANVTVNGGSGGTITFSDIVNGAQDLTLSAGGAITLNGVVGGVTPLDDLTITTNANPAINANVSGSGILTLDTLSAGTTMGLGGAAGTVNYSAAELGRFGNGWTLINIGNTAQTGVTTVGAAAWSDPVHFRANAAGSVVISGAQTAGAASDTTFTFTGPASLAANVDTTNATGGTQDITFNNAAALTANAQVLAGNGDIVFSSTINGAFDLTLNAAGTITLTGNVGGATPLDDLTLTSDADPTIGGSVAGTGVLTLQQKSNAATMGVAGGAGTLNYSAAELAGLGAGWSTIRLGSTTATGALTVGANAWASPVQYRSAAAGSIVISGAQTAVAASDASFTFSGPATLGANVSTVGATGATQDITFSDDVTLTANAQVLAGSGDILFSGTVDGAFDLTLNAAGTITLADDVGSGTALDDLTIAADADPTIGGTVDGTGILTLQQSSNATTMGVAGGAGALNYSLADLAGLGGNWTAMRFGSTTATGALTVGANAWDVPVTYRSAAGGSIVISGAQTAGAASGTTFTFSGPTTLSANVDTTNATGGTQDITFNNAVTLGANAQVLGGTGGDIGFASTLDGAFDLTLNTGGAITLTGNVGGATPLDDLTLTSDTGPTLGGAVEGAGVLTLQQRNNATTMGVAGGAGALSYAGADLADFIGWSSVRLGSSTATGALTVGAHAWDIPVDYRAAAGGSIVISGAQTAGAASDTIFTFSGPATINAALDLTNAMGGTQAITFDDTAVVNADIITDGGDLTFNDALTLNADLSTEGGDITLADDVTLTGTSSIDTDTADIDFAGTLDGAQDLTLATTGDISFMGIVGDATPLDVLTIAGAGDVTFLDDLSAADFILTGGTGSVLVTGVADLTGDIDLTTTGAVTFGAALSFGGDVAVDTGASDITFNGTVDGPGDFELTTTNDILFADDVGGVTPLGDVIIDPRHFTAGAFSAASFTFTNGTGNVTFGGTGLFTTGNISIDTNGNIIGTYEGANGILSAGAGTITATVSFTGLDIAGAGAALSAGYIGTPGGADQAMANLISIGGVSYPVLVPDPAYTFAGFVIGGALPGGGGGGGGGTGGGSVTPPVIPPIPGTNPGPVTPPGAEPGGWPVTPGPATSVDVLPADIARLQCSAEMMVQSAKLPSGAACGAASAHASEDALLQSR